jgi:hypothetical protein
VGDCNNNDDDDDGDDDDDDDDDVDGVDVGDDNAMMTM